QRHSPRCLQKYPRRLGIAPAHGLAEPLKRHVVQQHYIRLRLESGIEVIEVIDFNFHTPAVPQPFANQSKGSSNCRVPSTKGCYMMVLDQEPVIKAHAVIIPAATADRILLQ